MTARRMTASRSFGVLTVGFAGRLVQIREAMLLGTDFFSLLGVIGCNTSTRTTTFEAPSWSGSSRLRESIPTAM